MNAENRFSKLLKDHMNVLCVIPSRLQSTRLPKKALLPIHGRPMIQRVYENAVESQLFTNVVVATDSDAIADIVRAVGGQAIMTDPAIANGSLRVAATLSHFPHAEIIVNLQGDEPFVKPLHLQALLQPFMPRNDEVLMSTVATPLLSEDAQNPGVVKVVTDIRGNALYFSRAPIPYYREEHLAPVYHHVGLYAFRRHFLETYVTLVETPLERVELLEQLRVLENGYAIRVCPVSEKTLEINTQAEYEAAQFITI